MKQDKILQEYQKYRANLKTQDIGSFIDQNGKTYTVCDECTKKDCKGRRAGGGCMIGVIKADVKLLIKRGDK
jgi:hypothetical protein